SGKGIYQSPNGNSFTKINSGAFPANFHRVEIANCKNFPNVVYALFDNQNDTASVLCKRSDGGVTWIQLTALPFIFGMSQGGHNLMLGVCPTDSNKIIVGKQQAQSSSDGGNTWTKSYEGHADLHVVANTSTGHFFIGNDGGVWR